MIRKATIICVALTAACCIAACGGGKNQPHIPSALRPAALPPNGLVHGSKQEVVAQCKTLLATHRREADRAYCNEVIRNPNVVIAYPSVGAANGRAAAPKPVILHTHEKIRVRVANGRFATRNLSVVVAKNSPQYKAAHP